MSKNKVKPVSDLVRKVAEVGLNFAENQIEKRIENQTVEDGINLVFPITRQLLEVLNDDNPANADQVRGAVLAWINKDLAAYIEQLGAKVVASADNQAEKDLLGFLFAQVVTVLRIYSDQAPDNKAQVQAYFGEVVTSDELEALVKSAVIVPLLAKGKASEDLQDFVLKAVGLLFDALKK